MAMVCPQCATTHDQCLNCPSCGARLLFHDTRRSRAAAGILPADSWRQSAWARLVVGLFVAQGLSFFALHLFTAWQMAWQTESESVDNATDLRLLISLQLAALAIGGLLTGSGQSVGLVLGAVVGVWNGVLASCVIQVQGQPLDSNLLFTLPLIHTAVGALSGWLGSLVWRPLASAESTPIAPKSAKPIRQRRLSPFGGPVVWIRVALGTAVAVAGNLSARYIFALLLRLGDGRLEGGTTLNSLVIWEIKALTVICGGLLAGINRRNGIKQGIYVGLCTSILLFALDIPSPDQWLQVTAGQLIGTLCLSTAGGWFGSQLLPPLAARKGRAELS